jgi:hypothetical protein
MRALAAGLVAGILLLPAAPGRSQTPEIQKKLEKKLKQAREAEKKKAEARLGQRLAEALKKNPDLLVAEAKVRTAEAQRDQLRLKLVQEVTVAHAELERARAAVPAAQAHLDATLAQVARGAAGQKDVADAGAALQQAKANLAAAEAKLAYLVGKTPAPDAGKLKTGLIIPVLIDTPAQALLTDTPAQALLIRPPQVEGTMAERLRKALAAPFTLDSKGGGMPLEDVLDFVRQKLKGINVVCPQDFLQRTAALRLTEAVPTGAALQLIEEEFKCRFVLRDYGMRVVDAEERAPPGAVFVVDFWKQHQGTDQQKN